MPPLGSTKKTNRPCLVCGSNTNTAHMGLDVCRACNVFYRRKADGKRPRVCRSTTNRCAAGKGLNCKKCRLQYLEEILSKTGAINKGTSQPPVENEAESACTSSDDSPSNWIAGTAVATPLLATVKAAYEKMCFARLIGESFSRKDYPSTAQISTNNYPVYPSTFATMNHANRILMPCILDFGNCCFPEFRQLSEDEKRSIAVKFFYSFRMFDSSYRAIMYFADVPNRSFGGYTLWLSEDVVEHFFDDFDEPQEANLEEAKAVMANICRTKPRRGRAMVERIHPDEYEFYAMLILLFWAPNGIGASEKLSKLSEDYYRRVSCELHADTLKLDDYATRLGELYSFLPMFEHHDSVKETFEVFRLLDIFSDDSFTYKLNKA